MPILIEQLKIFHGVSRKANKHAIVKVMTLQLYVAPSDDLKQALMGCRLSPKTQPESFQYRVLFVHLN